MSHDLHFYSPATEISWLWINQIGPDAQDFLHRLTTVDVRNLRPGEGAPGCFLNPQGKVRAYFHLWHYAPGEFGFEVEESFRGELLAAIDQFTFAEKFALTEVKALASLWIFADGALPSSLRGLAPGETRALEGEVRACHHGSVDYGRAWITVWGIPEKLAAWKAAQTDAPSDDLSLEQVERWRIEACRPRSGVEITDATNPLEAGLKEAVAGQKGCYPGQEVIEKILALGAPARRLCRLDGTGPVPALGEKILNEANPPAELGEITSVAKTPQGFEALGYIRKIHAKEGLDVHFSGSAHGKIAKVAEYA